MRAGLVFTLLLAWAMAPVAAVADDRPGEPLFEFSYTNPAGGATEIPDFSLQWFPLEQTLMLLDPADPITYLEFEITGLTHGAPMDLNFILLDPNGTGVDPIGSGIELMDDAGWFGNGYALEDVTLLFADKGIELPHGELGGPIQPFPDTIYRPDGPGMFLDFYGRSIGTVPWYLVVIDDAVRDEGSFQSATLRGIPEPVTLTLLALGALVTLRRRRW